MATHAKCPVWPTANEIMISAPTKYSDKSPQELFSGVNVLPKLNTFTHLHVQHTYWTMPYKGSIIY